MKWLSFLESTKWLDHLKLVLAGASKIVSLIDSEQAGVLVHCSDGWDRTSQLTSLAQLLLDPYYRTFDGFQVLIEKEWIKFGHKFNERCGPGKSIFVEAECSPVFLQFIDCVYQVCNQFKCAFEFNEHFLITVLDHLYSCRFGTFLCNNESELEKHKVKENTVSLWSFIKHNRIKFLNPFYIKQEEVLLPVTDPKKLVFWGSYYFRFYNKTAQIKNDEACREALILAQVQESLKYKSEIADLKRKLENEASIRFSLENALGKANQEKEELQKAVDYTLCIEEGGNAKYVAKIHPTAGNGLVNQFCADLKGYQIIEDYKPPAPDEHEGFLIMDNYNPSRVEKPKTEIILATEPTLEPPEEMITVEIEGANPTIFSMRFSDYYNAIHRYLPIFKN